MKLEFGTGSRFGNFTFSKAQLLVNHALYKGIRSFDTGYAYGNYKSQPLLARCLEKEIIKSRENISISTKTPCYSSEIVETAVEKSLDTFKSNYIDTLYLWGPNEKELENKEIFKKLKSFKSSGKIKKILINTHSLNLMKKISTGFYDEISGIMLDFNLLKQDRYSAIKTAKNNGLSIVAGTILCQGLLIDSSFKIILRSLSPFYLGRMILKKETRRFLKPSKKLRAYCNSNFDKEIRKKMPLSFVTNESLIDSIAIGMMSISSINNNVEVFKNPLDYSITKKVGQWALDNCQIMDLQ